ncbi:MAG: stage III sporulation protein AG [Clostridium sp.]|nr:stage III sporulation protein AG [Clostridium sp.]
MDKIKKTLERIRRMFAKENNNKWGENLIIIIIVGMIIIIAGGTLFGNGNKSTNKRNREENEDKKEETTMENVLAEGSSIEKKVGDILEKISGAGKVNVMITYESGKQVVPFTDKKRNDGNTDEKDSAGGTRKSSQSSYESNVVYEDMGGGIKRPIIEKEITPKVQGVLVVAEGANEPVVKENIINAVKVLFNIPNHRIQVVQGG